MSKLNQTTILAIETSADETSAAVLSGNKKTKKYQILSNIIYSQIPIHKKTGGIVPEVAARAHIPKVIPAIKLALSQAKTNLKNIDAIAVTAGPGLITSLRIGVDTAKALAFGLGKPIIPVNHLEGHLLSAFGGKNFQFPISNFQKNSFPALGLLVSGGHTMLVLIIKIGQYKILGQTVDDAAGECFDKIAKILELPYPGGPALSKLAERGKPNINFPKPLINSKDYNFSFSGLKTAVLYYLQKLPKSKIINLKSDICASTEQAIIDVLIAKTIKAAKEYKVKTILLGGGVSANHKLRHELEEAIKNNIPNSKFYIPDSRLTTDNAAMIALAGFFHFMKGGYTTYNNVIADPNWELVSWK